ncbi:MAG: hypothetical protein P1R58_10200, partial [bacterium]|nr:hypothetical protein [bacterium]
MLGLAFASSSVASPNRLSLTGDQINDTLRLANDPIISNSDSVWLNSRLLVREVDYQVDYFYGKLKLDSWAVYTKRDTLTIQFNTVPRWLSRGFGNRPPVPSGITESGRTTSPAPLEKVRRNSGDLQISGTKGFRFNSRSGTGSEFGQSLDLLIRGELGGGVQVHGAVSDRGYNPAYGPSNQRISELDKVNLSITSNRLIARLGDIEIADRFSDTDGREKQVSGADLMYREARFHVNAVAARPRGSFSSVRFMGIDGLQGPYRIEQTGQARSIVSASEEVWLDGRKLKRGAHRDYVMDYAAGTITFTSNNPIDSRRRIEIDFEPLENEFRRELFGGGFGAAVSDSMITIGLDWLREGDNPEQLLLGNYSDRDRTVLEQAGDDADIAYRSGVSPDSLGSYRLVADSLPDSVFVYVGEANGEYALAFSFVGLGQGEYLFLGGEKYLYVGSGHGDYRPISVLTLAERVDQFRAHSVVRSAVGKTEVDWQVTQHDRNLLSRRGDEDNSGNYLAVEQRRSFLSGPDSSFVRAAFSRKEADFYDRFRSRSADFQYDFMIPEGVADDKDEELIEAESRIVLSELVQLSPSLEILSREEIFDSRRIGLSSVSNLGKSVRILADYREIKTDLSESDHSPAGDGAGEMYGAGVELFPERALSVKSSVRHSSRENSYFGERRGTRYDSYETSLMSSPLQVTYERFEEDSLSGGWESSHLRDRVTAESDVRLGELSVRNRFAYQNLNRVGGTEESYLTGLEYNYRNSRSSLTIGGSYLLSDESRSARSISFLKVDQGEGDYLFEDGQYKPQDGGDYIRIDEILSGLSRVQRGEKSFQFRKEFAQAVFSLNSLTQEELLQEGSRSSLWFLPVYSDHNQPYL